MRYVGTCKVTDLLLWRTSVEGKPHKGYERGPSRYMGFLSNRERFIVYWFALYLEGFQQNMSLHDTRSVRGCYILPLGLSVESC